MSRSKEAKIEREKRRKTRRAIQDRISELTCWLAENNASSKNWDAMVRKLHVLECQLESMDQTRSRSSQQIDYCVSLHTTVPMQY